MPKSGRNILDFIDDMLNSATEMRQFTQGMSFEEFSGDKKTVNAVVRSLEVLGEASKHIPKEVQQRYKEIPWSKMTGLRNILIHDYMGVDLKTVWNVIENRIPEIEPVIRKLRRDVRKNVEKM